MKLITVNMITDLKPCPKYNQTYLRTLIGDGKTLLQILDLDIPAEDRIWVTIRLIPPAVAVKIAQQGVHRSLQKYVLECKVPFVVEWATDWLSGKDRSTESAQEMLSFVRDTEDDVLLESMAGPMWLLRAEDKLRLGPFSCNIRVSITAWLAITAGTISDTVELSHQINDLKGLL